MFLDFYSTSTFTPSHYSLELLKRKKKKKNRTIEDQWNRHLWRRRRRWWCWWWCRRRCLCIGNHFQVQNAVGEDRIIKSKLKVQHPFSLCLSLFVPCPATTQQQTQLAIPNNPFQLLQLLQLLLLLLLLLLHLLTLRKRNDRHSLGRL